MTDEIKRSVWELCKDAQPLSLSRPLEERLGSIRLNLIALGDVGATLLLGLRLLGGDILASIGIFAVNENVVRRYELEMNQIGWPFGSHPLPDVKAVTEAELLDCDIYAYHDAGGTL